MSKSKKKRTRLSPDVRKAMILDHAADVIAAEGVSALSIKRLGDEAGISKSLVYAYFPSMQDVLRTLLRREYRHLRKLQTEAADSADTFEQLVRRITRTYLAYIEERGMILDRLVAEPNVADYGDPTEYSREVAVNYIARIVNDNFDIDMEVAIPTVDISFGLPAAAGHYLTRNDVNRQTIEDITVTMIIGAIEAILHKYNTSLRHLVKRERETKDRTSSA